MAGEEIRKACILFHRVCFTQIYDNKSRYNVGGSSGLLAVLVNINSKLE